MISNEYFVSQSLATHLFFGRIMKEHSFFLEISFTQKDEGFIHQADEFRREFDKLLGEVILISDGIVKSDVLKSGEVITPYTLSAEMATSFFTGVKIPIELTKAEAGLNGRYIVNRATQLEDRVSRINHRAIGLIYALTRFKTKILSDVLVCKMYTINYPLLIEHMIREANLYLRTIQKLQKGESVFVEKDALELEYFWNRQMAEHAKFIRGLLDPSEADLIKISDRFGREFDQLFNEAKNAMDKNTPINEITEESLKAAEDISDFKKQGTEGILECKIKSIIIPLLSDHVLREANHYVRLLHSFKMEP